MASVRVTELTKRAGRRRRLVAATIAVLAIAACGGADERSDRSTAVTGATASGATTTTVPATTGATGAETPPDAYDRTPLSATIPDDPAGRQLRWFLDAARRPPIPRADLETHFAPFVLELIPPDQLNDSIRQSLDASTFRFLGVVTSTDATIDAAVDPGLGRPQVLVSLSVTADGKIAGLQPKPFPLRSRGELGLDPIAMPEPTGPHAVGTATAVATDAARDGRRIPVQLWYPAVPGSGDGPAPYAMPATGALVAGGLGVPAADVTAIDTNARSSAAPHVGDGRLPVVLFSPGYGVNRTLYSGYGAELASHGYVVAVIDHPGDGAVVEFPDGTTVTAPKPGPGAAAFDPAASIALRASDAAAVLDELRRLDAEPGGRFHDALDLDRVAFAGHSIGGATAAEAMRTDPSIDAGVNLDGSMSGGVVDTGLDRPFLLMSSDGADDDSWSAFRSRSAPSRWIVIDGTAHMAFSDWPTLSTLRPAVEKAYDAFGTGTLDPARSTTVQHAYLVAFLDHHLRGTPAPLLDGPSPDYPEVAFR
jgi:predicted dienelactone hydrolase